MHARPFPELLSPTSGSLLARGVEDGEIVQPQRSVLTRESDDRLPAALSLRLDSSDPVISEVISRAMSIALDEQAPFVVKDGIANAVLPTGG